MKPRRIPTSTAVALALLALLGFALAADWTRGRANQLAAGARDPREHLYVPGPEVLLRAAVGYRELVADLLWIRALVYFGQYFDAKHDVPWLEHYVDGILALAPMWREPYFWGASVITYQTGQITDREARLSASYLERGLQRYPDDTQMMFLLAMRDLTDIKPRDAAEREQLRVRGAEMLGHAARQPGAPAHWAQLAAKVLKEEGRRELAISAIREQLLNAEDEARRAVFRKELAKLESEAAAAEADRERTRFIEGWKRTAPYVPATLFTLLGEPASTPPFDIDAVLDDPAHPIEPLLREVEELPAE